MELREAMLHLAAIHPILTRAADEFESDYGSDIPTAALGHLGTAFVDEFEDIAATDRGKLFASVELLLTCGNDETETAVATGFIEAVVSRAESNDRYEPVAALFGLAAQDFVSAWNESLGISESE